jgi:hypothetical protein
LRDITPRSPQLAYRRPAQLPAKRVPPKIAARPAAIKRPALAKPAAAPKLPAAKPAPAATSDSDWETF